MLDVLTLSTLVRIFSRLFFYFLFLIENRLDISCKLSPDEINCINAKAYFLGNTRKKNINLPSAELALKVAKVNGLIFGDLNQK